MNREVRYLKSFYWKDYLVITVGIMLFAVGFTGFIMPNEIVVGGLGVWDCSSSMPSGYRFL